MLVSYMMLGTLWYSPTLRTYNTTHSVIRATRRTSVHRSALIHLFLPASIGRSWLVDQCSCEFFVKADPFHATVHPPPPVGSPRLIRPLFPFDPAGLRVQGSGSLSETVPVSFPFVWDRR